MKAGRLLRRPAALIVFVSLVFGSIVVSAQQSDDFNALNQQIVQLYRAGKYAEAANIARRALSVAERQFGPDDEKVGTALNNLAELYRAQGRSRLRIREFMPRVRPSHGVR